MASKSLREFCKIILAELENPSEKNSSWFSSNRGLCANAMDYDYEFGTSISKELKNLFNLDSYPFNEGRSLGEKKIEYIREAMNYEVYENSKRMLFLRQNANG